MRIAIVGAGPAGCHLAHRLGGPEHEILLFDPRAPYEKPCGGGLSPLVGRLFPDVMALPFPRHQPTRVQLRASDGSQVERELEGTTWAVVSRAELGQALLERALAGENVRLVREQVTGIAETADGWRLHTAQGGTYAADSVMGADGVRSVVRRRLVGPIPRQHLGLAVGYRVRGAPDILTFQTYADLEGYLWSFPRRDHASVGIVSRLGETHPRDLWQRLDRFLDEMCPGALKESRWAGLLPMAQDASLWDVPCSGLHWALLGDAAGHVHPITGEGIGYALWSAELLADTFKQRDLQAYQSVWQQRCRPSLFAASATLATAASSSLSYEILFQLAMAIALSGSELGPRAD
jgi:flavin-dependent dehydrogenase